MLYADNEKKSKRHILMIVINIYSKTQEYESILMKFEKYK